MIFPLAFWLLVIFSSPSNVAPMVSFEGPFATIEVCETLRTTVQQQHPTAETFCFEGPANISDAARG